MKYKYKIKISADIIGRGKLTQDMAWVTKFYGKPTLGNLCKWLVKFNESLAPGGVNHWGDDYTPVGHAYIVTNDGNETEVCGPAIYVDNRTSP
jgi:hypothetical protein